MRFGQTILRMKELTLFLLISFFFFHVKGQIPATDSGNALLPEAIEPTGIKGLNHLARKWLFSNTDSSIHYAQQALIFARKTNNKKMEGEAFYLLGGNYWIMANYPKALGSILESLQLFENLGDREAIADDYRAMASIYRDQGDFINAIYYADKCKAIAGNPILVDIYTIIGSIYEKFDRLDSAMVYLKLANDRDIMDNGKSKYGYISLILGNVYYKKLNYSLAITYYREGIKLIEVQKVYKDLMEGYTGIAKVYRDMSQADSSVVYAKKALRIGMATPFLLGMLDASSMLSQIYRSRNNFDSTLKYMDLSLSIKDTLYNQQKAREFQTLVFKEQLREQEIEEARARSEEERRENIQMVGIAAFIPAFFIVVLILSRRRLNRGVIDFMVLVGLLLFFEFISLLIHPHLELWTHHTPVLMLLALVAIASILVPSHHRLEEWLIKGLARSHKPQMDSQPPEKTGGEMQ
jgi:tetratricopeptide (TPR) repeat protein